MESAETLFVPVAVRNNSKGDADERVLESFSEPAWNNPVVRVIDANRTDLAKPLRRDWTVAGVAELMVTALERVKRPVPGWLGDLARERRAHTRKLETAVFGMT